MSTSTHAFFGRTAVPAQPAARFTGSVIRTTRPFAWNTLREMAREYGARIVQAVSPVAHAEQSSEQKRRLRDLLMLNRMADEMSTSQPALAAELRLLACRD